MTRFPDHSLVLDLLPPTLTSLTLQLPGFRDSSIPQLLSQCPHLQQLSLQAASFKLTAAGLNQLMTEAQGLQEVTLLMPPERLAGFREQWQQQQEEEEQNLPQRHQQQQVEHLQEGRLQVKDEGQQQQQGARVELVRQQELEQRLRRDCKPQLDQFVRHDNSSSKNNTGVIATDDYSSSSSTSTGLRNPTYVEPAIDWFPRSAPPTAATASVAPVKPTVLLLPPRPGCCLRVLQTDAARSSVTKSFSSTTSSSSSSSSSSSGGGGGWGMPERWRNDSDATFNSGSQVPQGSVRLERSCNRSCTIDVTQEFLTWTRMSQHCTVAGGNLCYQQEQVQQQGWQQEQGRQQEQEQEQVWQQEQGQGQQGRQQEQEQQKQEQERQEHESFNQKQWSGESTGSIACNSSRRDADCLNNRSSNSSNDSNSSSRGSFSGNFGGSGSVDNHDASCLQEVGGSGHAGGCNNMQDVASKACSSSSSCDNTSSSSSSASAGTTWCATQRTDSRSSSSSSRSDGVAVHMARSSAEYESATTVSQLSSGSTLEESDWLRGASSLRCGCSKRDGLHGGGTGRNRKRLWDGRQSLHGKSSAVSSNQKGFKMGQPALQTAEASCDKSRQGVGDRSLKGGMGCCCMMYIGDVVVDDCGVVSDEDTYGDFCHSGLY